LAEITGPEDVKVRQDV